MTDKKSDESDVSTVYVRRDEQGAVQSLSLVQDDWHAEALSTQSDALKDFSQRIAALSNPMQASDLGLARVLEDLIDLLVDKQLLRYTDLPQEACSKLQARRQMRGSIRSLKLIGDEDGLI